MLRLILGILLQAGVCTAAGRLLAPENLQIEFRGGQVFGFDAVAAAHFTWSAPSEHAQRLKPTDFHVACRVRVSDVNGSIVYDSGRVQNSEPMLVAALPLASDSRYTWSVCVWNNESVSEYSKEASLSTGLLQANDWTSQWIKGGKMYRKEFDVPVGAAPSRVSAFVSACQYYELYLDGQRIGDHRLDVGTTMFDVERMYATHDLEPALLSPGRHAVGLLVGQGFCGDSSGSDYANLTYGARLQVQVHRGDGSMFAVSTDETWQASSDSPIVRDSTYNGEVYNASLEQPGWAEVGFEPPSWAAWSAPTVDTLSSSVRMISQFMQPIRQVQRRSALKVTEPVPGTFVYDFGQEFAGWARIDLDAELAAQLAPGANITLAHAEALQHPPFGPADGSVFMGNLFWANPVDSYFVAASRTPSTALAYEPRFTYHGFRYVSVTIDPPLPEPLQLSTVSAVNVRTDAAPIAELNMDDGDGLLQRISSNAWWTESAALMSIPAGCAGRGERMGWVGDAAIAAETEMVDFDTATFWMHYLDQVPASQCKDGSIGSGIPGKCHPGDERDPSWSSVYPTVAWNLLRYHGATAAVKRHYTGLRRYFDDIVDAPYNATGIQNGFCFWGDWNPAFPVARIEGQPQTQYTATISHITAAATVVHDAGRMADIALALNQLDDAAYYRGRAQSLRKQYHEAFYDPVAQHYGDGTLTAQAVALWLHVPPTKVEREATLASLVRKVEGSSAETGCDGHLCGVGFIGVRYLFEALAQQGRIDVALRILRQTTYPGFGYEILNKNDPATTLWESFDADSMHQWIDESSRDHHYMVQIQTFFRRYVAGLDLSRGGVAEEGDDAKPMLAAFASLRVRPEAADAAWTSGEGTDDRAPVRSANASVATRRGTAAVAWRFVGPLPQPPAPAPAEGLAVRCAVRPQYSVDNGGLYNPQRELRLQCPPGEVVEAVDFARWGVVADGKGWFCYGSSPPAGTCEGDVSEQVAVACKGRRACSVDAHIRSMGDPCGIGRDLAPQQGGYTLIARVNCSQSAAAPGRGGSRPPRVDGQSSEERTASLFEMDVTVPAGAVAEAHVPLLRGAVGTIRESGIVVWRDGEYVDGAEGISAGTSDDRFVAFQTASGQYSFTAEGAGAQTLLSI